MTVYQGTNGLPIRGSKGYFYMTCGRDDCMRHRVHLVPDGVSRYDHWVEPLCGMLFDARVLPDHCENHGGWMLRLLLPGSVTAHACRRCTMVLRKKLRRAA